MVYIKIAFASKGTARHPKTHVWFIMTYLRRAGEREIYFKSHLSLWEHSSHIRLIGRGVPSVSVVSQLMYKFLGLASPKENPQVPMWKTRS